MGYKDRFRDIFKTKPTHKIVPVDFKIIEEEKKEDPKVVEVDKPSVEADRIMTADAEELFNKVVREIGYGIVAKAHDLAMSQNRQVVEKEDLKKILIQLGYISSS
jgi:histone H3/H4